MPRITLIVLLVLGLLTGVIFAVDPSLDIRGAAFFHSLLVQPELRLIIEVVRDLGPLIIVAAVAPALVTIARKTFWPGRPTLISSSAALFLIFSLALGPGLLVNKILKDNWARPRPGMVTEFGGDYVFKPWWDPRGTCESNCSFVSGETSSAVWMTAPALLVPPPWRFVALGAAGVYAVIIGGLRMLVGGHFLSDVIFAAIFTGLVIWVVHGLFLRWPATRLDERTLDAALEKFGRTIARFATNPARGPRPDKRLPPA